MRTFATRLLDPRLLLSLLTAVVLGGMSTARAATITYTATLTGANESPPVASAGTGTCQVDVDDVAHTMHVHVVFNGLTGNTTASHIHCATTVAFAGTAGVATTTPTFAGFPLGVTAGVYDNTLDLTLASSYNPSFVTAHTNVAGAETFLLQSLVDGKAYLNVHSSFATGGEIRGFLTPGNATPTSHTTWGELKSLYR